MAATEREREGRQRCDSSNEQQTHQREAKGIMQTRNGNSLITEEGHRNWAQHSTEKKWTKRDKPNLSKYSSLCIDVLVVVSVYAVMASQSMEADCDNERMQTRRLWVERKEGKNKSQSQSTCVSLCVHSLSPFSLGLCPSDWCIVSWVSFLPWLFQLAFSVSQRSQPTVVVAVVCHSDNKRQIEDARLDDKLDSEEESSGDWKESNNQFRLFQKPSVRLACFLGSWIWDFFLRKMQTNFTYFNKCVCTLIWKR